MANYYICNTSKGIVGRSAFGLNAGKCPKFKLGDIVYMANMDHEVHSRLEVTEITPRIVTLTKKPEITISIAQKDILSQEYLDKYARLNEHDVAVLEKCFIHNIKIFPFYDYKSENQETDAILDELRERDFEIEAYPDAIKDSDALIDERLEGSYSVLIVDGYGVVTFKCIESDPFSDDKELSERFINQIRSKRNHSALMSSPQLTDERSYLNINHIDAIIFETRRPVLLNQINKELEGKNLPTRVFDRQSFIEFLEDISERASMIDEVKRVGIVQALLPMYINSKTANLVSQPLAFTPDDTFELDDIQKDTLHHLNKRVHIKASAGSGKTILLLAKAYEVARANPSKEFLLLCYNSELSKDIQNQANNTGRNIANLKICTFDKLLTDLNIIFQGSNNVSANFNARKKAFVTQVMSGKINLSYGGIFLDEVQQMRQEWLDALFNCLDEEKYMVVSGDYYQSINPSLLEDNEDEDFIEEGDNTSMIIGGYKFETIILDKNYRNTKSIARVLEKMVFEMNNTNAELEIPAKKEKVLGHAYKKSVMNPRRIRTGTSPEEKIKSIVAQVDTLVNNYDCATSDILLVSPSTERWTYYLVQELRKTYPVYNFAGNNKISPDNDKSGIKMGTIGKSIGLDFKAVIFYNTSTLRKLLDNPNNVEYIYDLEALKKQSFATRQKFMSVLRYVYVACSRARDILIVLDDEEPESLFTEFIKKSGLEEE